MRKAQRPLAPLTRPAQGAALHLTHWANNATPARFYDDTSAGIAARFVASDEAAAYADALVVNNHYDTDGCGPAAQRFVGAHVRRSRGAYPA